jgi:anti-sigma B factor antagonist
MESVQTTGTWNVGAGIQELMLPGLMRLCRLLSLCVADEPKRLGTSDMGLTSSQLEREACTRESHTLLFDKAIDLSSSPDVRKNLLSALATHQHLNIDFTHLPYIDSAGIAVFVEALSIAKQQNRSMVFVGVQGPALQHMKLTRLNQVFTLLDSVPR